MRKWRVIWAVIGSLITVLSYYGSNAESNQHILGLFAPKYVETTLAYQRAVATELPVRRGDPGFEGIESFVKPMIMGKGDLTISEVKLKQGTAGILKSPDGALVWNMGTIITVTLNDGRSLILPEKADLRIVFRDLYLKTQLYALTQYTLWLGVLVILADPLWPRLRRVCRPVKKLWPPVKSSLKYAINGIKWLLWIVLR